MKTFQGPLFFAAASLVLLLPSPHGRSQQPLPTDPLTAIQALSTASDDLLKRQEATLKDLSEMTDTAREARIFAKRG